MVEPAPRPTALSFDAVEQLETFHQELGLGIHELTTMPGWEGEKMDYEMALDALRGFEGVSV